MMLSKHAANHLNCYFDSYLNNFNSSIFSEYIDEFRLCNTCNLLLTRLEYFRNLLYQNYRSDISQYYFMYIYFLRFSKQWSLELIPESHSLKSYFDRSISVAFNELSKFVSNNDFSIISYFFSPHRCSLTDCQFPNFSTNTVCRFPIFNEATLTINPLLPYKYDNNYNLYSGSFFCNSLYSYKFDYHIITNLHIYFS